MENSQQPQENQNPEPQINQAYVPQQPIMSSSDLSKQTGKKKNRVILAVASAIVLLVGATTAYVFLVYIPNKPENVFKKAVTAFSAKSGNYTVSGRLDQAGPNDPDYDYSIKTDAQGNSSAEVHVGTFLQHPNVFVQKVNGKLYVRFTEFEDSKKLASHYSNYGQKGIQEYLSEFTDRSNLTGNQDKWFEVGDYIVQQPAAQPTTSTNEQSDFSGMTLSKVGAKETVNGKPTIKYEVTLTADAFKQIIGQFDSAANVPVLSGIFPKGGVSADQIKADVWVNTKTKTIEQISYDGRPFRDATFSLKLVAADNHIDAPQAEKLTSKLGYGIVTSQLFNKQYQQGSSDSDRERIADLKGIKTALEIYKARTGHYPERYEMSVNQESFIGSQMPGADFEVFKDPAGRFIGRSGSQYAYVPALNNDSQDCGRFSKPCEKYFINTTLDDGKQYQLNSD